MRGGAGDGRRKGRRRKKMQESHRRFRNETVHLPEHERGGDWGAQNELRINAEF